MGLSTIEEEQSNDQFQKFKQAIENLGFELIEDKKHQVIEIIKAAIIKLVKKDFMNERDHTNTSDYLRKETDYGYSYISMLFSTTETITIEKYIIIQKI